MKNDPTKIQNPFSALLLKGAEYLLLFLTFVIPVKFASIVSVPEMPASYWFDPISILFTAWPVYLFCFVSTLLLMTVLTAHLIDGKFILKNKAALIWSVAFILLSLCSLTGWINASCKEYPLQMITYTFGTGSFILTAFLLIDRRPELLTNLFRALLCGTALSIFSGIYQYFWGFDELIQHVKDQMTTNGLNLENDGVYRRIIERRIQADFSVCNVYAGYLAMMLPVMAAAFWKFGNEKVQPEKVSRWLLSGICAVVMLLLLIQTGSRGGVLAVGAGLFGLCLALPMSRKQRITFWLLVLLGIAGFILLIVAGRGAKSMIFRADYDYGALQMMWKNPFVGTGWGDFFHDFQIVKLIEDREAPHTPHNFPLLYGSQCGIISFLIACFILLYPLILHIRHLRKNPGQDIMHYAILTAICSAVLDYLLELSYETPAFLCTWAILVFGALYKTASGYFPEPRRIPAGRWVLLFCILATIPVAVLEYRQMYGEMKFNEFHELMNPRYSKNAGNAKDAFRLPPADQVLKFFRSTTEQAPHNPFPWMMMSDYLTAMGDLYNAKGYVDKAISLSPQRSSFYMRRARLTYRMTGSAEKAAADLQKVRELFPKNPEYKKSDLELLTPQKQENKETRQ